MLNSHLKNKNNPQFKSFIKLENWLVEKGVDLSLLRFQIYGENDRGMHAADDIQKGQTILRIPYDAILSP